MKTFSRERLFRIAQVFLVGAVVSQKCSGFNNDGKTDIVWRKSSGAGDTAVWYMNGTSFSSSQYMTSMPDTGWKMVGTGDFNNDGQLDLLWRHQTTGLNAVWLMNSSSYLGTAWIQGVADLNWEIVGTGYFDGYTDKNIDILWRNKLTGDNAIWFMQGTSFLSAALIQETVDLNWKVGGTGDFNNDGFTDILWRNYSSGQNWVWYMNGSTLINSVQLLSSSDLNWEIVGTGHFNLDGTHVENKVDILWRHKTYGDNAIWQMNGISYVNSTTLPWVDTSWKAGGTGDAKADTEGDGLPDLWERRYFGNLDPTANGDPDGDGAEYSNLNEYYAGTDPTVAGGRTSADFGAVLQCPELTWTTWTRLGNGTVNGWNNWQLNGDRVTVSGTPYDASSYLRTILRGPGILQFSWSVNCTYGSGLSLELDDATLATGGGSLPQQFTTSSVGPGIHTFQARFSNWNSSTPGANSGTMFFVRFLPDADQDGLDDRWETQYFGTLARGPNDNTDGDGSTNLQEYQNGTNPAVAESTYAEILKSTILADAYSYETWSECCDEDGNAYGSFPFLPSYAIDDLTTDPGWLGSGWLRLDLGTSKNVGYSVAANEIWLYTTTAFPPATDSDLDGLPDTWEQQYFGNLNQATDLDPDGDGFTNGQEYLGGTSPNSFSGLQLFTPLK